MITLNIFQQTIVIMAIRNHSAEVFWHKHVWFQQSVPRRSVIQWLAILGRLSTKDRLQSWGVIVDGSCVQCKGVLRIIITFFCVSFFFPSVGEIVKQKTSLNPLVICCKSWNGWINI